MLGKESGVRILSIYKVSREPSVETSIFTALALSENPQEFCRRLFLSGLGHTNLIGLGLLAFDAKLNLQIIAGVPNSDIGKICNPLEIAVRSSLRPENLNSIQSISIESDSNTDLAATIIPSYLSHKINGVIVIVYQGVPNATVLRNSDYIALALACELYCNALEKNPKKMLSLSLFDSGDRDDNPALTSRQMQVLELISEGKTNESIARILNYSLATIKNDVSVILAFYGVRKRSDALVMASLETKRVHA